METETRIQHYQEVESDSQLQSNPKNITVGKWDVHFSFGYTRKCVNRAILPLGVSD